MCVRHLDGAAVLPAASGPRAQHHACRPAACLCRSAACSCGHCSSQPCPLPTVTPALQRSSSISALCSWCWRGLPQTCLPPHHTDNHADHWRTCAHESVVAFSDTRPVFCAPALTECRSLRVNQITGSLPAAWSTLDGYRLTMWVPCVLLIISPGPACNLAVSAAWQSSAACIWCSCAASCQPAQGTASGQPASCLLVGLSCCQQRLLLLPSMPLAQSRPHCSTAAPSARFAASVGDV
jgi:hypothetical protein